MIRSTTDKSKITNLANKLDELNNGYQGLMQSWWEKPHHIDCVAYYLEGDKPIACAMYGKFIGYNIGVWVHPDYRNRGIGTKLIKKILKRTKNPTLKCDYGAAPNFFSKFKHEDCYERNISFY